MHGGLSPGAGGGAGRARDAESGTFSFSILAGLEPISDSARVLSVINNAMGQMGTLQKRYYIDRNGQDIPLNRYGIAFDHVDLGYDNRQALKTVSFTVPQNSATAVIGPSGRSGRRHPARR
ncbi:MAG: hypothetical protein Q4C45_00375 [Oscillospiraceae bacterium]|nr:hypothetical protein [Oscillospiraceae bacterium]